MPANETVPPESGDQPAASEHPASHGGASVGATQPRWTWARISTVAAIVAASAAIVVAVVGIRQLDAATQALQQNFVFAGGQECIAYRDQVIKLHDRGLSASRIADVFAAEINDDTSRYAKPIDPNPGGAPLSQDPYRCGAISQILKPLGKH